MTRTYSGQSEHTTTSSLFSSRPQTWLLFKYISPREQGKGTFELSYNDGGRCTVLLPNVHFVPSYLLCTWLFTSTNSSCRKKLLVFCHGLHKRTGFTQQRGSYIAFLRMHFRNSQNSRGEILLRTPTTLADSMYSGFLWRSGKYAERRLTTLFSIKI